MYNVKYEQGENEELFKYIHQSDSCLYVPRRQNGNYYYFIP